VLSSVDQLLDEEAEGGMQLAARRLAYPALERMGAALLDDVAVPVAPIAEILDAIRSVRSFDPAGLMNSGKAI
jgi:glycolate oxidase